MVRIELGASDGVVEAQVVVGAGVCGVRPSFPSGGARACCSSRIFAIDLERCLAPPSPPSSPSTVQVRVDPPILYGFRV